MGDHWASMSRPLHWPLKFLYLSLRGGGHQSQVELDADSILEEQRSWFFCPGPWMMVTAEIRLEILHLSLLSSVSPLSCLHPPACIAWGAGSRAWLCLMQGPGPPLGKHAFTTIWAILREGVGRAGQGLSHIQGVTLPFCEVVSSSRLSTLWGRGSSVPLLMAMTPQVSSRHGRECSTYIHVYMIGWLLIWRGKDKIWFKCIKHFRISVVTHVRALCPLKAEWGAGEMAQ